MATVNLDVGGLLQPTEQTVDQSSYDGDTLLNVNALSPNTTLTVTNTNDSPDVLELQQTIGIGLLSTTTLNLGENANVKLTGLAGVNAGSTFNYNLENGSTLEMTSEFLSLGLGNTVNVDLGADATSTFVYDSTGINVELSGFPNVTGVTAGDQIQVANATSGEYVDGDLIFKNDLGVTVGRFNAEGLDPDQVFFEGGTMTYACYLKGTHIATPDGEVKVETLKAGDQVLTASGSIATVKWLGFRKLNRDRIPADAQLRAAPIRIAKGALAENIPHRDLTVSPGHRFDFDGALIPALSLVNGLTITQDFTVKHYEYFHVELEHFDMLLAEGAAAESYLDVGDYRNSFENAETVAVHPDFGPAPERVALPGYVQKITPEIIEPVRRELFKRAQALTGVSRTADAKLQVQINGITIDAATACTKAGVYQFELPAELQSDIRILSNSVVVRDTSLRSRRDTRVIGVGLADITLIVDGTRHSIGITTESLAGLNDVQDVYGTDMRWTTGEAVIPATLVPSSESSVTLELNVLRTHMYWTASEVEKARKAA